MVKTLLMVCFFGLIFTECKKGDDDPVISFRSRKARVVGKWKLTSGSMHYSDNTGYSESLSYTETKYNILLSNGAYGAGAYSLIMSFKKDGSYEGIETIDSKAQIITGTWNFSAGVGKGKNKEQIVVTWTSVVGGNSNTMYAGNQVMSTYDIKELRNKKMVLVSEYGRKKSNSSESWKYEYTLVQ